MLWNGDLSLEWFSGRAASELEDVSTAASKIVQIR